MTLIGILFLLATAVGIFVLPRHLALLPLLMGACYMTGGQSILIGPFHFTVLRILIPLGFIRSRLRQEQIVGGYKGMDRLLLMWGAWYLFSSVFHKSIGETLVYHLGGALDVLGFYFLIRLFCQTKEDLVQIIKITAFVLVPVAIEMINEKFTGHNIFGYLGGVPVDTLMRDGKVRAQGPFGHPILAGTVGAFCVPLMIGIWIQHPRVAKIGLAACLGMVLASASSGPIMTVAFGVLGLVLWRWRRFTGQMRIAAVLTYIACDIFMTRPAYYLLEKIDLTGSSTGYHRAAIIDAGIKHFDEWWAGGTDYTRHWMPYGVSWSEDHSDITNQYLFSGVNGGFALMVLFTCMVWLGFRYTGQTLRLQPKAPFEEQYLIWSMGAMLFAHATTMMSVAYFDQSIMFFYLNLAVITTMHANALFGASNINKVNRVI